MGVWQWAGPVVRRSWWRKWKVSPCAVREEGREGGGRREDTPSKRCGSNRGSSSPYRQIGRERERVEKRE